MRARLLKKLLNNTKYHVHETSEHICIGSPLCSDLISVRKDNLKMRYALDTFREGKKSLRGGELLFIWEKLEELIITGEIQEIINGEDVIENPLPVFICDENYEITSSVTDVYGWPNTDIKGVLMYDNTWFPTKKEAMKRAISDCEHTIRYSTESLVEYQEKVSKIEKRMQLAQSAKSRLEAEIAE